MAETPRASVILSVYQQARFLPWVLEALSRQQTSDPWELIICDDGSSEEMLEAVKQFSRSTEIEVRSIWQSKRGFRLSRSRNNGVACARGQILIFLDGDALVASSFVSSHIAGHDGSRRLLVGSRSYLFLEHLRGLNDPHFSPLEAIERGVRTLLPTTVFQEARLRGASPWSAICGCNFSVLHSADVLFDEEFISWGLEDYELALRLYAGAGYELRSHTSNMVYHLEDSQLAGFHPCRPKDAAAIAHYIGNMRRIAAKHPGLDLADLWSTLDGFRYDEVQQGWRPREEPACAQEREASIGFAKGWHPSFSDPVSYVRN